MAVIRDISGYQKAERALNESHQRLRDMAAQNEAAREEERKHIAREVHDELGQVLTTLRMDLSLLGMRYGTLNPDLLEKLKAMKGLVDCAIQGVRNVAVNLRPAALDMGLVSAIEWLCRDFTERTAVHCVLDIQEENLSLDDTRNVVLFRIVQESLTNITRYAQASRVDVTLGRCCDELWVEVRDDGCGFDPTSTSKKSFGLLGMRERALALGGQAYINSVLKQGTTIRVTIPIHNEIPKEAS
jgi:signal transduction histidine kinase